MVIDFEKIDPRLVPEVNIGTLGHVDHGKSTLVQSLTGKWTSVHSEELKRGITIKLGYADATVYKCGKCNMTCTSKSCPKCFEGCEPIRTISFVDAPGHETLMATVLSGASLMDGILFVIAANEKCPQPQTKEHLMVLNIVGIKNIIIVQTKIDLVSKEQALENYKQIKQFVKGTIAEDAPIIPVSSEKQVNMDILLDAMQTYISTPVRDSTKPAKMLVVRSFDINKPGTEVEALKGGILGGALIQGELKVGDEIEIRPGIKIKETWSSLKTKVIGLQKAGKNMDVAGSGGLLGVMTELDNSISKADSLTGSVAGKDLPQVLNKLMLKVNIFNTDEIEPLKMAEQLMVSVGTARTLGIVKSIKKDKCEMDLRLPVCADKGDRAVLARRIMEKWKLIGWGFIE
jgi:translation initiation factor 2 subunit 3